MRFDIKFLTVVKRTVEAESLDAAAIYANAFVARMGDDWQVRSIFVEGEEPVKPSAPLGRPPTGPTPGTPTIRQEVLADAIAEAA